MTPIFKKGSSRDPGNYRPVSLTSLTCKVMEMILKESIMQHLNNNRLIRTSQHSFIAGRSCTTNLVEFLEVITAEADRGEPVDTVFLDFAKAFDKVPTQRLLKKLRAHGIGGRLLAWIRSWLNERRQRVVLDGETSSWAEVLSGVPHGSVLGPILFIIFINDLDVQAALADIVSKFADDTKAAKIIRGESSHTEMQQMLDGLHTWSERWAMQFNIKKCKIMHFGSNNPKREYFMNGEKLQATEEERDIGVLVTPNLKPGAQCRKAAEIGRAHV